MLDARSKSIILVTGPSGAGRSTALHVLEDLGYECIDNMPLSLVPRLIDGPPLGHPVALGVDPRNRDFSADAMLQLLSFLVERDDLQTRLLYIDAKPEVLLRRYSETRRPHPFFSQESLEDSIDREVDLLLPIRSRADVLIDTSDMSPHELKAELGQRFASTREDGLAVTLQSFSYKRGVPQGVDMVFDCRFLKNPHWEAELRPLTGKDDRVVRHIETDSRFVPFFSQVEGLVDFLLPAFREEGKSYLTLAFGCTGGRHRSVAVAEMMAKALATKGWQVSIRHREIERLA